MCNVIGGETINWEDGATLVASLLTGTFAAWAESEIDGQIDQFENNGLTVRSGHTPCVPPSTAHCRICLHALVAILGYATRVKSVYVVSRSCCRCIHVCASAVTKD